MSLKNTRTLPYVWNAGNGYGIQYYSTIIIMWIEFCSLHVLNSVVALSDSALPTNEGIFNIVIHMYTMCIHYFIHLAHSIYTILCFGVAYYIIVTIRCTLVLVCHCQEIVHLCKIYFLVFTVVIHIYILCMCIPTIM